jgi:hypothetical protein
MKRKKRIKYSRDRVVLSDTLPYETPITFSNRYFYKFLSENSKEIHETNNKYKLNTHLKAGQLRLITGLLLGNWENITIPFSYKIRHKNTDFRELALIHPASQLSVIHFYDKFKELILYYCSVSNFSIRKPVNIAKYTFFNDTLFKTNKGDKDDLIELESKEYETLKTFFTYEKYTNIFQFYEDYRYHRAEKKYNHLYRFDITKCFDSIYTHTISWACLGIESVKEEVQKSKSTFSGEFDRLLQEMNYQETNGIVIGPEFSRIFSEIILQRIDKDVENILKEEFKLSHKQDYELYRYVDDYFLFCDEEHTFNQILEVIKHQLKKYKLSINNSKNKIYKRPLITELTIAQNKIKELLSNNYNNSEGLNDSENFAFPPFSNSKKLITEYKTIIKESEIDYKDILNYTLGILTTLTERYTNKIITLNNVERTKIVEDKIIGQLEHFIDFIFFVYSVSPRVNSTIKVTQILSKIIFTIKKTKFINYNTERIFKKIVDESVTVLKKNKVSKYSQLESLYLLVILRELGREYRLSESILLKTLDMNEDKTDGELKFKDGTLNYFSIVVLYFYIGNINKYRKIKDALNSYLINYITDKSKKNRYKSSEMTHLIMDMLTCPYINDDFKEDLYKKYCNDNSDDAHNNFMLINKFNKKQKYWFVKWKNFNLVRELESKRSQEVYS